MKATLRTRILSSAVFVLASGACLLGPTNPVAAQEPSKASPAPFYDEQSIEGDWYHYPEFESDPHADVFLSVYKKIASAKGERSSKNLDSIVKYGPGHWTYEWEQVAAAAQNQADRMKAAGDIKGALEQYERSARFYATGSSPHIRSNKYAMAALEKARKAMRSAAELLDVEFSVVSIPYQEKTFEGYLYLPPGKGPFPLVIVSNGSDVVKEEVGFPFILELHKRGLAAMSIDMPGIGGSGAYNLTRDSGKLHKAAVAWARRQPGIQPDRIAISAGSYGGNAAAHAHLTSDSTLAAVVSICGSLHSGFVGGKEFVEELPQFTADGLRDRYGLPPTATSEELAKVMSGLSLKGVGPSEAGAIARPLLVLSSHEDPVAPLDETKEILLKPSANATLVVEQVPGHCPSNILRAGVAPLWLERVLKKQEAISSVQR